MGVSNESELPSLSDITNWDVTHLESAATDWSSKAEQWESHFTRIHQGSLSPGGTAWEGVAADTAQDRTFADLVKVRGLAENLHSAARIARSGADDLAWARRQALAAVADAERAKFTVGENLSVRDQYRSAPPQRAMLALEHAEAIAERAGQLKAMDNAIAAKLTGALAPLDHARFPESPEKQTVRAVDFKEAPPPSRPYPINEVIAEATDLDGNHVVMRRGYYDATTQKGFGWDKAFWRHGVINKNVFVDLISHSRPVSNDNGTLVYEVPINRAHCTTGMFGTSCEDTGESLTMKIVVNTKASPDVPGGGQKGLITMYPLAGGSGVVEMGPNWTWTPPWVNNNVPIN